MASVEAPSTPPPDVRSMALDLHAFLRELDRRRLRHETVTMQERLAVLRARIRQARTEAPSGAIQQRLSELEAAFEDADASRFATLRGEWAAFRRKVHPAYESLARALRAAKVDVPSLRPMNHTRAAFHVVSAVVGILIAELLSGHMLAIACGFAIAAWSMESSRRFNPKINDLLMKAFGPVAHPHERFKINSATWYATALVLLALVGDVKAGAVGIAVLGVGDPMAATIGRRFGRTKLLRGRSLEGSLAFVISGAVAAFGLLFFAHPEVPVLVALIASVAAAMAGAFAELFGAPIDDNFSIPVSATLAALGVFFLAF